VAVSEVPWLQAHRGKANIVGFFESMALLQITRFEPHTIFDGGDKVVVLITLEATSRGHRYSFPNNGHLFSMPSWEIFEDQTRKYRGSVLPPGVVARVALEQASTFGWERYLGASGRIIGMETFGASAPLKEPQRRGGFESERVVLAAKGLLRGGHS
jgi:transketolase